MASECCKICGGDQLAVVAHTAKCSNCGVLLFWPYPKSDKDLASGGEEKSSPRESVLNWYSESSFYNHTNFTNMLRFTMGESYKGRTLDILDYGGGGGQFSLICKSHFPEATVYITDISDAALLDEWRPMNVQIPFTDFAQDQRRFDVIFMNDVFEHVSDPVYVLAQLSGKLKQGGAIFIDTPRQFWIYPATRLVSKSLHEKILRGTVSVAHLQIWTRSSFELVVKKCGLTVARYKEESEFTMPASFYMRNMGITNPFMRTVGSLFYRGAKYIARNKIVCVLSGVADSAD